MDFIQKLGLLMGNEPRKKPLHSDGDPYKMRDPGILI